MPSSCSCVRLHSAASSSSSPTPCLRGQTSCGPGRKLLSTAGEDAARAGVLGVWGAVSPCHPRAVSLFQDGRVPCHSQPDAHHALWKCHCVCDRGALWPVSSWQEVRKISLLEEGTSSPAPFAAPALRKAVLSSCINHAFGCECCCRVCPCWRVFSSNKTL